MLIVLIAFASWISLSGWGNVGHEKIGSGLSSYFQTDLVQFQEWSSFFTEHSSDADKRKGDDKSEGSKHYIDVDNYPEFIEEEKISQNLDSLIEMHGSSFVESQGYLPWATLATYDSLVSCFLRFDYEKAKVFAADLSHYVADGHMPLHITNNYNGQFSNNKGIHSRYESKMIGKYNDEIEIDGGNAELVENVSQYVFNYIYDTYTYVDTILDADDYAKTINSNTSTDAYTAALWLKTKTTSKYLFYNATNSFADLFYTAWVSAGSPDLDRKLSSSSNVKNKLEINSIFQNDSDSTLQINFSSNENSRAKLSMYSLNDKKILSERIRVKCGEHQEVSFPLISFPSGFYIVCIESKSHQISKKIRIN